MNLVALIDYTIDEALRRKVPLANVERIISLLGRYGIDTFDISFKHVYSYRNSFQRLAQDGRFRCRVLPTKEELSLARRMGFQKVAVRWLNKRNHLPIYKLETALRTLKEMKLESYLYIEDASRSYFTEFNPYWPLVERYGVKRVIYCDNQNVLDPLLVYRNLLELLETATCPIEFCAANAFGLATANTLAALKAGIDYAGSSVCGTGPKGRAAMEEVLMVIRYLWKHADVPLGGTLANDCADILSLMNLEAPVDKAVIGTNVFAHESGIHVDGISKNPELYEMNRPEDVGLTRKLVIGKHSGTASLKCKFKEWGVELETEAAARLLEQVRELAERQKAPLSDHQLLECFQEQSGCCQSNGF